MLAPAAIPQQKARTTHRRKASRPRSLAERMSGQYWRIARLRRSLENIAACFTDQAEMFPLQCSTTIERLNALRRAAIRARAFLCELDPETTRQLKPWGSIEKLSALDYQTTRAIVTIAMFAPLCQEVCYERVELHVFIRSLFPRLLATFEDTISQLAALVEREVQL